MRSRRVFSASDAASPDAALIDGHTWIAIQGRLGLRAASPDAALIDGHFSRIANVCARLMAASPDAALIDGHQLLDSISRLANQPHRPTRP